MCYFLGGLTGAEGVLTVSVETVDAVEVSDWTSPDEGTADVVGADGAGAVDTLTTVVPPAD